MIANRSRLYAVGAGICNAGLILIVLGFFLQILDNFFYRQPYDRMFYLGAAFILTFTLCRTFRVMERKAAVSRNQPAAPSPAICG